jgi:hypothetical protein
MIKSIKVIVVSISLTVALAASSINGVTSDNEQLQLDDLYVCSFWPTCRDPDQQKPTEIPTPKPNGDTDTGKDKKDQAQLA